MPNEVQSKYIRSFPPQQEQKKKKQEKNADSSTGARGGGNAIGFAPQNASLYYA